MEHELLCHLWRKVWLYLWEQKEMVRKVSCVCVLYEYATIIIEIRELLELNRLGWFTSHVLLHKSCGETLVQCRGQTRRVNIVEQSESLGKIFVPRSNPALEFYQKPAKYELVYIKRCTIRYVNWFFIYCTYMYHLLYRAKHKGYYKVASREIEGELSFWREM